MRKPTEQETATITAIFGGSHIFERDIWLTDDKDLEANRFHGFIIISKRNGSHFCFNPNWDDWEIIDRANFNELRKDAAND